MIQQWAKGLVKRLAPDPQTHVLLNAGAKGIQKAGFGVATGWDRWTAPAAWRLAAAFGRNPREIPQPGDYPGLDLAADDPIAAILADPRFARLAAFFNVSEPTEPALVSAYTQALLYALIRNLRPEHVVEIGTYRLSTSKAICRALHANGGGMLHTVDPNAGAEIVALIRRWPPELRKRLCYYPASSMEFFTIALYRGWTSELVFVDGNHDYEYALFDICSAARIVRPGGFIAIDNISQAGPLYAARDFLRERPGWRECGHSLAASPQDKAFDLGRSTITGTDLCVIRAPSRYVVGQRPETIGMQEVDQGEIGGVALDIASPATGTLHAQYVVRVVKPQTTETTIETSVALRGAVGPTRVTLPWVFEPDEIKLMRSIELWLGWSGDKALELSDRPAFY